MDNNKKLKSKYFIFAAFILIALDQITKFAVKGFPFFGFDYQGMHLGQSFNFIGEFVKITFVENEGMAFGITFGAYKIILSLFSVVASAGLYWFLVKLEHFSDWVKAGIALIFAGAVGNLIDRVFYGVFYGEMPLFYGRVVDFIQVDIPDITIFGMTYTHWPVFNIADACVTVGVVFLLFNINKIPSIKELRSYSDNQLEINSEEKNES